MNAEYMDLLQKLERLDWLLRRYHVQNHMADGPWGNPHRGQGRVLALLRLHPEISQKDLSHILDIRSQSLGELLAKLEKNGYITRTPSEEDRRVMMIRLTEAGGEAADKIGRKREDEDFFSCLTAEEQTTLGGLLDRVIQNLEQQIPDDNRKGGQRCRKGGHEPRGGFDPREWAGFDPRAKMRHMHMGGMGMGGFGGHAHYHGKGEDFVDLDTGLDDSSSGNGEE